jgi:hypothetical protein
MRKKTINKGGYHCKGNVMTAISWFGGAFEATLIPAAAYSSNTWVSIACIILACLMFLAYFGIYLYFVWRDPDRLQSEQFNLYQHELMIEQGDINVTSPVNQIINVSRDAIDFKDDSR